MASLLRELYRRCSQLRASIDEKTETFEVQIASLNVLIAITGSYFGQGEEYSTLAVGYENDDDDGDGSDREDEDRDEDEDNDDDSERHNLAKSSLRSENADITSLSHSVLGSRCSGQTATCSISGIYFVCLPTYKDEFTAARNTSGISFAWNRTHDKYCSAVIFEISPVSSTLESKGTNSSIGRALSIADGLSPTQVAKNRDVSMVHPQATSSCINSSISKPVFVVSLSHTHTDVCNSEMQACIFQKYLKIRCRID